MKPDERPRGGAILNGESPMSFIKKIPALVLAIGLVLAGPLLLLQFLDVAAIRTHFWAPMLVTFSGVVLALAHAVARRTSIASWTIAALTSALGLFLMIMLVVAIRIPSTGTQPVAGQRMPAVQLSDVNGARVDLADLYHQRPLILLFFRGVW